MKIKLRNDEYYSGRINKPVEFNVDINEKVIKSRNYDNSDRDRKSLVFFNGKTLDMNTSFKDYGIKENDTLDRSPYPLATTILFYLETWYQDNKPNGQNVNQSFYKCGKLRKELKFNGLDNKFLTDIQDQEKEFHCLDSFFKEKGVHYNDLFSLHYKYRFLKSLDKFVIDIYKLTPKTTEESIVIDDDDINNNNNKIATAINTPKRVNTTTTTRQNITPPQQQRQKQDVYDVDDDDKTARSPQSINTPKRVNNTTTATISTPNNTPATQKQNITPPPRQQKLVQQDIYDVDDDDKTATPTQSINTPKRINTTTTTSTPNNTSATPKQNVTPPLPPYQQKQVHQQNVFEVDEYDNKTTATSPSINTPKRANNTTTTTTSTPNNISATPKQNVTPPPLPLPQQNTFDLDDDLDLDEDLVSQISPISKNNNNNNNNNNSNQQQQQQESHDFFFENHNASCFDDSVGSDGSDEESIYNSQNNKGSQGSNGNIRQKNRMNTLSQSQGFIRSTGNNSTTTLLGKRGNSVPSTPTPNKKHINSITTTTTTSTSTYNSSIPIDIDFENNMMLDSESEQRAQSQLSSSKNNSNASSIYLSIDCDDNEKEISSSLPVDNNNNNNKNVYRIPGLNSRHSKLSKSDSNLLFGFKIPRPKNNNNNNNKNINNNNNNNNIIKTPITSRSLPSSPISPKIVSKPIETPVQPDRPFKRLSIGSLPPLQVLNSSLPNRFKFKSNRLDFKPQFQYPPYSMLLSLYKLKTSKETKTVTLGEIIKGAQQFTKQHDPRDPEYTVELKTPKFALDNILIAQECVELEDGKADSYYITDIGVRYARCFKDYHKDYMEFCRVNKLIIPVDQNKITIVVDDREKKCEGFQRNFQEMKVHCIQRSLPSADFVLLYNDYNNPTFNNRFAENLDGALMYPYIFERKTWNDFSDSEKDFRSERQSLKMKAYHRLKGRFYIIEGEPSNYNTSSTNRRSNIEELKRRLDLLTTAENFTILKTNSIYDTSRQLALIAKMLADDPYFSDKNNLVPYSEFYKAVSSTNQQRAIALQSPIRPKSNQANYNNYNNNNNNNNGEEDEEDDGRVDKLTEQSFNEAAQSKSEKMWFEMTIDQFKEYIVSSDYKRQVASVFNRNKLKNKILIIDDFNEFKKEQSKNHDQLFKSYLYYRYNNRNVNDLKKSYRSRNHGIGFGDGYNNRRGDNDGDEDIEDYIEHENDNGFQQGLLLTDYLDNDIIHHNLLELVIRFNLQIFTQFHNSERGNVGSFATYSRTIEKGLELTGNNHLFKTTFAQPIPPFISKKEKVIDFINR